MIKEECGIKFSLGFAKHVLVACPSTKREKVSLPEEAGESMNLGSGNLMEWRTGRGACEPNWERRNQPGG